MASYKLNDKIRSGDGRELSVKDIADLYRSLARNQVPVSGQIEKVTDKRDFSVKLNFSFIDVDLLKAKYSSKFCFFKSDRENNILSLGPLTKGTYFETSFDVSSENGIYRAQLKIDHSRGNNQVLEIYKHETHLKTIDISEIKEHDFICTDSVFGSLAWSKSGSQDRLLYVAQANKAKSANFFGYHNEDSYVGNNFNRYEHWGDTLTGITHSCVAILDVGNEYQLDCFELTGESLANPVFCDGDNKVACISFAEKPRKFGLRHHSYRPNKLLIFDAKFDQVGGSPKVVQHIGLDNKSIHSLRASPTGDKLIFFTNELFGAFRQPSNMYLINMNESLCKQPVMLFQNDRFNIESSGVAKNCFTSDGKCVYLSVSVGITIELLCLDIEKQIYERVPVPTNAVSILDLNHNFILIQGSNIDTQPTILLSSLNEPLSWFFLNTGINETDIHVESEESLRSRDGRYKLSAIYVSPILEKIHKPESASTRPQIEDLPTLVMIHERPHTNYVHSYSPMLIFYARLGIRALLLNYRGSCGVNLDQNNSIIGKIGLDDVDNCLHIIESVKDKYKLNYDKIAIAGGSIGGFLACHLSCQRSINFSSAIILNPVVDLISMYTTSDVPDVILAECLGLDVDLENHKNNTSWHGKPENILKMYQQSPLSKVADAHVPTLMLLGNQDLHVPMSQGLRWVDELTYMGVEMETKIYNDSHSIGRPHNSSDALINSAIWILSHIRS